MKRLLLIATLPFLLIGCTSVKINKVDSSYEINQICIEKNNAVTISDFVPILKNRIEFNHIKSIVYQNDKPEGCEYHLWYTALRSWDLKPYLSHAELRLYKDNALIADATYHLKGGGGLNFSKFKSTQSKIDPLVDQLLNKK